MRDRTRCGYHSPMFNLAAYLRKQTAAVDTALDRVLPGEDVPPQPLHAAMRYSVFSGGKRLRPILCLAAAEVRETAAPAAMDAAVAVELLHTYTLIHDDLPCMDDDDLRRGKPTCHIAFGEAHAVLAGDALQALAFERAAAASRATRGDDGSMVMELARAAGSRGVVGGQVADLVAQTAGSDDADMDFIHLHKTADLFRAAVRMGALAGHASPAQLDALTSYAVHLGLAFQITDDLIDASADREAVPGEAKTSCLQVMDPAEAHRKAAGMIQAAHTALEPLPKTCARPLQEIASFVLTRKH